MGNAIFVATETGSTVIDGEHYSFSAGKTRVREGHPLLEQCAEYFSPADHDLTYDVERATAGPGEKRRSPAKAKAAE